MQVLKGHIELVTIVLGSADKRTFYHCRMFSQTVPGSEVIILHPGKDLAELEGDLCKSMRRGFGAQSRG